MVFVKHNSLKSDIFFNPIFIPGFSGSRFSELRFLRVQVFQGPGPGSRVQGPRSTVRVRVQGPRSRFQQQPRKKTFGMRDYVILHEVTVLYKNYDVRFHPHKKYMFQFQELHWLQLIQIIFSISAMFDLCQLTTDL